MATIEVTATVDQGDDVLRIEGTIDGQPAVAYGWVSATAQHYPAAAYDGDRLRPGATPRPMTDAERAAYTRGLLGQQGAPPVPAAAGPAPQPAPAAQLEPTLVVDDLRAELAKATTVAATKKVVDALLVRLAAT